MLPLLIAIAVACIAFWKVAWKLLAITVIFVLVMGVVMIAQYLHHMASGRSTGRSGSRGKRPAGCA